MTKEHDVLIVGAGSAGLFAANELAGHNLKVLLIDKGKSVKDRGEKDIMCGVGGAGTYSDGTLNLRPDIGGNLFALTRTKDEAWKLVEYTDGIFLKYGAPKEVYKATSTQAEELRRKAASAGIEFIEIVQRHMGSDNAVKILGNFEKDLRKKGVDFLLNTDVEDIIIEKGACTGVVAKGGKKISGKYIILCPGRVGGSWLDEVVKKHEIVAKHGPIDVGVRVEVPAVIMDPVIKINRDPKFHIRTKRYDDLTRTFCMNHEGFVVKEQYNDTVGVNGHSMKNKKSKNTNFAFLTRIHLTEPLENTTKYGKSIAKLATTIGGGRPLIQRVGDLKKGRRSTWARIERNIVRNTLTDVTPGDISMALPHRILMNTIEGLEKLNEVIPGVMADSTLLYAPEIKFYAVQVNVNYDMETNIKNLFAAGDGAGLSRDIINAASTGVLAGRGILRKAGKAS